LNLADDENRWLVARHGLEAGLLDDASAEIVARTI
jgi:hypothetical protein